MSSAARAVDNALLPTPATVLRFTRTQRLVQKSQFDSVYQRGVRASDACFLVVARPNDVGFPRLGLSISARSVGNAVARNRIKRLVRESFRLHQQSFPAVDFVVNSRNGARDADSLKLKQRLEWCWREVMKRCAHC